MDIANYQMPDQKSAADFLEKFLQRKCKTHPQLPCEYIHLKPSEFSPRLCCKCMEVRNIPFNEAVSIRLLLQATSSSTFNAYPKFSDSSITQKIEDVKVSNDRISTELSSFFMNLNSAVSQAIEKAKSASKQKLASLSNTFQGLFDSLSQISQIETFQELVKNTNEDEGKLRGFIQAQYSQMNNYTDTINIKLLEYQKIQQSFSLTDANNKLKQIVDLIEGITLFSNIANTSIQPLQKQQKLFQQPAQQCQLLVQQSSQQQQQQQQKHQYTQLTEQEDQKILYQPCEQFQRELQQQQHQQQLIEQEEQKLQQQAREQFQRALQQQQHQQQLIEQEEQKLQQQAREQFQRAFQQQQHQQQLIEQEEQKLQQQAREQFQRAFQQQQQNK